MPRTHPMRENWRLAMLLAVVSGCPGPKPPERGYGQSCTEADDCLADRECVEIVRGRERVCGQSCRLDDDECATRAHPDAYCRAEGVSTAGVCVVPCSFDDACPGDLVCGSGGWCVPSGPEWVRVAGPLGPSTAKVDVLVLIDNSGTMAEEQDKLGSAVGGFLDLLLDPPDVDGDGSPDYTAVEDINLGVISSDMGTGGFVVRGCSDSDRGDDGCLQSDPGPRPGTCAEIYPRFLSRSPANSAMYTVDQLAQDFACMAYVGINGCGFEQSLAAARKALTDQVLPGGCNVFFLRPDAILVLLFVTDEDDCSVRADQPQFFDVDAELGEMNLRCFLRPELLDAPSTFQAAFTALREATPARLVLGFIAGVPPDVGACQGYGDALDLCLAQPEMVERIDPVSGNQLLPSCNTTMGRATPPRRLVELARLFGHQAAVGSICALDWAPTMERVAQRVAAALPGGCFPEELPFDVTTCRTSCRVLEVLADDRPCTEDPECTCGYDGCTNPRSHEACEPLRRDAGTTGEGGATRRVCILRQATRTAAHGRCSEPADQGWFFIPQVMSIVRCPVLSLDDAGASLVEEGSVVYVECGPEA